MLAYRVLFVLCLKLIYLSHSFASTENSENLLCLTVGISGAAAQPQCNGRYHLDTSFETRCSGRQEWFRNEEHGLNKTFVYYLEEGYNGWVVATAPCSSWGNFMSMVKTDSQAPFTMTEIWSEYSVTRERFIENSEMKVKCVERALDYCSSSPCANGSKCVNKLNGFTCQCDSRHTDHLCNPLIITDKGSPRTLIVQKLSVTLGVVLGVVAIAMFVSWIFLRKRKQRREEEQGEVVGEVKRNIYIGSTSSQQYKLLEESAQDYSIHASSEQRLFDKF